jgi:hypothetical protein
LSNASLLAAFAAKPGSEQGARLPSFSP